MTTCSFCDRPAFVSYLAPRGLTMCEVHERIEQATKAVLSPYTWRDVESHLVGHDD